MRYRKQFGEVIAAHVDGLRSIEGGCAVFQRPHNASASTEKDKLIAVVASEEIADALIAAMSKVHFKKFGEVLDRLTTSVAMWGDHHEELVPKDFVASGENQGCADAYTHVAGGLTTISLKVKDGDLDGAFAEALKIGDEVPADDEEDELVNAEDAPDEGNP
jgi:hypothetical protein